MRMLPSRYLDPKPALVKRQVNSSIVHVPAPLKGLSLATKFSQSGETGTATMLKNFVVDDDRITVRAGYIKECHHPANQPIWHLIPHYATGRQLAATNNLLFEIFSETELKTGFASNDWHWTSFSNLGGADYTVMVNGVDGVWSWDGSLTVDPAIVNVTSLSGGAGANPAVCTVAAGDIAKFKDGQTVVISGADATHNAANGPHVITSVGGPPANTFKLVGVDLSTSATGPQTTGVTADPPGALAKETIAVPTDATWINPNQFQIVLAHQNRLFFADSSNLAVYYLPLQQKSTSVTTGEGRLQFIPLNVLFRRGGSIRAMYSWTLDGGAGMDDQLVIFSTNGEAVIYGGTDPEADFKLVGIFRFDAPMSKHSVVNWGGDLYCMISTGLTPMSTMIKAETEQLAQGDRHVLSLFLSDSTRYRSDNGWQVFLNPSSQRMFCNIPQGATNKYRQLVRHMPRGAVWTEWSDIPARCWSWVEPYVFFGDDLGNVFRMHPQFQSDDGKAIKAELQLAWSNFKTPALKQFKLVQPYFITDGDPRPFIDIKVNYDYSTVTNQPDTTFRVEGTEWNTATWAITDEEPPEGATWTPGARPERLWNGIATHLGRVGAVRMSVSVEDCMLAVTGFDITWEQGGWI